MLWYGSIISKEEYVPLWLFVYMVDGVISSYQPASGCGEPG
jgi:hypothetical protein